MILGKLKCDLNCFAFKPYPIQLTIADKMKTKAEQKPLLYDATATAVSVSFLKMKRIGDNISCGRFCYCSSLLYRTFLAKTSIDTKLPLCTPLSCSCTTETACKHDSLKWVASFSSFIYLARTERVCFFLLFWFSDGAQVQQSSDQIKFILLNFFSLQVSNCVFFSHFCWVNSIMPIYLQNWFRMRG